MTKRSKPIRPAESPAPGDGAADDRNGIKVGHIVDVITDLLWDCTPHRLDQVAAALIDRRAAGIDDTIDEWLLHNVVRIPDEQPDRPARMLQQLASLARQSDCTFVNLLAPPLKCDLREMVARRTQLSAVGRTG